MYDSLAKISGIEAVNKYLSTYQAESGPDGLSLVSTDGGNYGLDAAIPELLRNWLIDLRLLRTIPLSYLVPDAALLPPESIRFFHVDPTWVDRMVDGVFAAANTGTVDFVFSYSMLQMCRVAIDAELTGLAKAQVPSTGWTGDKIMTGMLIRSELTRRWPDMVIRAYTSAIVPEPFPPSTIPVLRAEPISKDIYIALFGGQPATVHVREPNVGTRYGVESKNEGGGPPYKVDSRPTDGNTPENAPALTISFRPGNLRVINLEALGEASVENTPRQVALNLEQLPYVQEFKQAHPETWGSKDPATMPNTMTFRRPGRSMTLDKLKALKAQLEAMES